MPATVIPKQKIDTKDKTDDWAKAVMHELDKYSPTRGSHTDGRSKRSVKQINYDLLNGRFNRADFSYVTSPYGYSSESFPAELQHYDIISPKINLLVGEEMKRPFNFRVVSENSETVEDAKGKKKELILNVFKDRELMGKSTDEEIQKELAKVEDYVKYSYKDMKSLFGQHALNYLVKDRQLIYLFNRGFVDALVSGEEIYWTGIVNGEPVVRQVNPLELSVVLDPNSEFIDDAQAIIEERWITLGMILDEFYDELTPEDIDKLEDRTLSGTGMGAGTIPFQIVSVDSVPIQDSNLHSGAGAKDQNGNVRVVRYEWRSMRKIGFMTKPNVDGQEETIQVDETYKVNKNEDETVEWKWINEYWEGVKILDNIFVGIGPKKNQRRRMDNPNICKSGYVGIILNNRNSVSVSLVGRAKAYQYLYNIIYYRLELALAKSKGKAMIMDIAQIPTSEGWDVQKWMYYLDALGVGFINSHEEGKRGQSQGKTSNFNQFTSVDLTMGDFVQQCVNILDKIEDKVGELMGVTRQRLGEIQSSELVGNTERAVSQSSHVTEYLFNAHNEVKRRVLTSVLEYAKIAWRKGKKINYVDEGLAHVFYEIDGDTFDNSEYGVFVSNTPRDTEILSGLRSLAQVALQSDKANLTDVIAMMKSDSIIEIERRLEQGERRKEEAMAQQQKEAQAVEQAKVKQAQDAMSMEIDQKEKDRQNKLQIAQIQALGFAKDQDTNSNDVPDVLEVAELTHKVQTEQAKLDLEKDKLDVSRKNSEDERVHTEKLAKMNQETERMKIQAKKESDNSKIKADIQKAKMKPKPKSK